MLTFFIFSVLYKKSYFFIFSELFIICFYRHVLDKRELKQLKQAFSFFDKDGNGTISPEEIGQAIQNALGIHLDEDGLNDIMNDLGNLYNYIQLFECI